MMMDKKTFPKHVEFYSKNKFEKLVHLSGFILRIPTMLNSKKFNFLYKNSTKYISVFFQKVAITFHERKAV
jgi:hypothetical protein